MKSIVGLRPCLSRVALIIVGISMTLTGCQSSQTTPVYYLLSEAPARIIEVDPTLPPEERLVREFDLSHLPLSDDGPEGLAFIPNSDLEQYGYAEILPTSDQGGYFLIVTQRETRLYVVELPLDQPSGGPGRLIESQPILNLTDGAADIDYANGEVWTVFANAQMIYRLIPSESSSSLVKLSELSLNLMPVRAGDVEGFALAEAETAFMGDDAAQTVTRYDDFTTCVSTFACSAAWSRDVSPFEPSGLAWDADNQRLIGVDDEGVVFSLSPEGEPLERILTTDYDLEGIAIWQK